VEFIVPHYELPAKRTWNSSFMNGSGIFRKEHGNYRLSGIRLSDQLIYHISEVSILIKDSPMRLVERSPRLGNHGGGWNPSGILRPKPRHIVMLESSIGHTEVLSTLPHTPVGPFCPRV
jgi:hypothetical protein